MNANKPSETVLVVIDKRQYLLPMSTSAFFVATGSKTKVKDEFVGAIVVYRAGIIRRIKTINFVGLLGDTFWKKLFSFFNGGVRAISVDFVTTDDNMLGDIRDKVIRYLSQNLIDDFFSEGVLLASVLKDVSNAQTCSEMFEALKMPPVEEALDSLSC